MRLQRSSPAMVVALLALFVALGGVGYAAITLPKNSVGARQLKKNAVTGKKVRKNAVTSPKVKDFSLRAKDFRAGELPKGEPGPPGPTFGATAMGSSFQPAADPTANPDDTSTQAQTYGRQFEFTLPAGGRLYVRFFISSWGIDCSAGVAQAGLYLDGTPVSGSGRPLNQAASPSATELVAVVAAGAGAHVVAVHQDCPGGSPSASSLDVVPTWTVVLLGS
jgi:hypothetical protein